MHAFRIGAPSREWRAPNTSVLPKRTGHRLWESAASSSSAMAQSFIPPVALPCQRHFCDQLHLVDKRQNDPRYRDSRHRYLRTVPYVHPRIIVSLSSKHTNPPSTRSPTAPAPSTTPAPPTAPAPPSPTAPWTPSPGLSLALLNVTAVLWGTQHAVIKYALTDTDMSPSTLNLLRFSIAGALSLPALGPLFRNRPAMMLSTPVLRYGLELSVYMFAGYALQSAALLSTTASRSAFLLYLNVKLVPLFARVLYGRRISGKTWLSAALALFGTVLLALDNGAAATTAADTSTLIGDVLSVAAAAASALFILRTERAAKMIDGKMCTAATLNAVTLCGVAGLTALWATGNAVIGGPSDAAWGPAGLAGLAEPQAVGAVVYLAVVTTALCNYVQAIGQRGVAAERAAVVFAMDPVYGAGFAWGLLGERLGAQGLAGAAAVVVAALVAAGDAER